VTSSWFLIHTELRCTVNHKSDLVFKRLRYFGPIKKSINCSVVHLMTLSEYEDLERSVLG